MKTRLSRRLAGLAACVALLLVAEGAPRARSARSECLDRQLAGAMHLAVAGQDLFGEGGAGAGHAQHEDRHAGGMPPVLARGHELRREERQGSLHQGPVLLRVVGEQRF